jgi:hypothetical protein
MWQVIIHVEPHMLNLELNYFISLILVTIINCSIDSYIFNTTIHENPYTIFFSNERCIQSKHMSEKNGTESV